MKLIVVILCSTQATLDNVKIDDYIKKIKTSHGLGWLLQ